MNLKAKPYINLDDSAVVGIAKFYDASKDDAMNNQRRPGLGGPVSNYFVDLGTDLPVDDVYEWEYQGIAVAVSGGRIFKITKSGAVTEITGATVAPGYPLSCADFGDTLYLAARSRIIQWTATDATCAYIADADAPVNVSHLAYVDGYLLALDLDNDDVRFAEVDQPTNWLGEFFGPDSLKDKTSAVYVANRELIVFGSKTIEYWGTTTDATAPFQRFEGTQTDYGTIAPYSPVFADNTWFFLDHLRNVVRLAGRSPQVVSNPFDAEFKALDTVSDARGMHIHCGNDVFYVLTFPTEDRTYAYDYKRDVWGPWSYYINGEREAYLGQCACYMRAWNKHLVGSRKDGKIFYASRDYYQDGGNPVVWEVWTGWEGNGEWRGASQILMTLKRGQGPALTEPEPILELFYRDSNTDRNETDFTWKGPRHINLGQLGEASRIYREKRLGRYRSRQYRFRCAANVPVVLMSAEER